VRSVGAVKQRKRRYVLQHAAAALLLLRPPAGPLPRYHCSERTFDYTTKYISCVGATPSTLHVLVPFLTRQTPTETHEIPGYMRYSPTRAFPLRKTLTAQANDEVPARKDPHEGLSEDPETPVRAWCGVR